MEGTAKAATNAVTGGLEANEKKPTPLAPEVQAAVEASKAAQAAKAKEEMPEIAKDDPRAVALLAAQKGLSASEAEAQLNKEKEEGNFLKSAMDSNDMVKGAVESLSNETVSNLGLVVSTFSGTIGKVGMGLMTLPDVIGAAQKGSWKEAIAELAPTAGAVAGSVAGGALGGLASLGLGAPGGAFAGGVAGGELGEKLKDWILASKAEDKDTEDKGQQTQIAKGDAGKQAQKDASKILSASAISTKEISSALQTTSDKSTNVLAERFEATNNSSSNIIKGAITASGAATVTAILALQPKEATDKDKEPEKAVDGSEAAAASTKEILSTTASKESAMLKTFKKSTSDTSKSIGEAIKQSGESIPATGGAIAPKVAMAGTAALTPTGAGGALPAGMALGATSETVDALGPDGLPDTGDEPKPGERPGMQTGTSTAAPAAETTGGGGGGMSGSVMGAPQQDGSVTLRIDNFVSAMSAAQGMMKKGIRQSG